VFKYLFSLAYGGAFYFYRMRLVTVRRFDDYISAHLVKGRLKEEDIVCHLMDEHTITTTPFFSTISGGIKLMVPEIQEKRAVQLLTQWEKEQVS